MTEPSHGDVAHGPSDETTGPAFFVACVGVLLFGLIELPPSAAHEASAHHDHPAQAHEVAEPSVETAPKSIVSALTPNEVSPSPSPSAEPAPSPPVLLDMGTGTRPVVSTPAQPKPVVTKPAASTPAEPKAAPTSASASVLPPAAEPKPKEQVSPQASAAPSTTPPPPAEPKAP